ncbi:MAG: GntR family transcriptional regulator, partial [Bacilli bacterium]|nr:GntR family transcriptional regulator [Bacilli bacterium]MDY5898363.1 GntR family transcriptional regulator [Bacilli bacterium]
MTKDSLAIYQSISNDIITMKLKPGDMLKEIEVANKFNVSRTPIRDVFKRLEYDKLLDIHSQKGSFVSKINLEGIT